MAGTGGTGGRLRRRGALTGHGHLAPSSALRSYLARLDAAGATALDGAGEHRRRLVIGGRGVVLRFAGPALVPVVMPALGHLERRQPDPGASGALTVTLWDSRSTGVARPPPTWRAADVGAHGQIGDPVPGGPWAALHLGGPKHRGRAWGLTAYDPVSAHAHVWMSSAATVPWYERAAPLRTALHWGLSGPRRLFVHAAAVGGGGGGLLLAGPAGAGKSTTALAATVTGGLGFVGDDYVLLDRSGSPPRVYSLYSTAKISPEAAALYPRLGVALAGARAPAGADGHKLVLDMGSLAPGCVQSSAPVSAVVVLRLGAKRTRAVPGSPAAALRAMAPSSILQLPGPHGHALSQLAGLLGQVPVHVLEVGPDPAEAGDVLGALLGARLVSGALGAAARVAR